MRTPRDIGIGKGKPSRLFPALAYSRDRTIHGMVYNAMKLFMEINPQLFDDCSQDYTEHQNSAASRETMRERKWAAITEQASKRKSNGVPDAPVGPPVRAHPSSVARVDEMDPVSEDNQKRLDSLKLQDGDRRERRPTHERQNSVGSQRSQR